MSTTSATTAAAIPIAITVYQSNGPSILPSTIGPRESASALQNRIGGCRGPNDGYRDRGRIALGGEPQSARGSCRRGEGDPATAMYSNGRRPTILSAISGNVADCRMLSGLAVALHLTTAKRAGL